MQAASEFKMSRKDAHVKVYSVAAEQVAEHVKRGTKISPDDLMAMEASEIYSPERLDQIKQTGIEAVNVPEELSIFPPVMLAPRFICFCLAVQWSIGYNEHGQLQYYLGCKYFCVPLNI